MPTVFAISSATLASRVGLTAATPVLQAWGVEVMAAPTTALGRHPGWGQPGGGPVPADILASAIAGAIQHPRFARAGAAMTGYFASPEQVEVAAEACDRLKDANPDARIVVDPVMGDAPKGLYVPEEVAHAIAEVLVPRADLLAPNVWEAARLSGRLVRDPVSATKAALGLGSACLISSVRQSAEAGPRIGAVYAERRGAWYAHVAAKPRAPKGVGDALCAAFVGACLAQGDDIAAPPDPETALATAVGFVGAMIADAQDEELPSAGLHRYANAGAAVEVLAVTEAA